MARPRKHQINDRRTRFTPASLPFALGGATSQTIAGGDFTSLLGASKTGAIGGVQNNSPAILRGGAGPYALAATNQFSITIPGVNGGVAVTVTIQAGDIVTLGGSPVLTVSRLANRINTTLAGYGVSYPVATNDKGVIVLTSSSGSTPLVGSSASIRITDITPGVVGVMGFGVGSTFVASGHSEPVPGIITYTPDGLGAYTELDGLDGEPAFTVNPSLVNISSRNTHAVPGGDAVIGRLSPSGSSAVLSFLRRGMIPGKIITSNSNFSTLLAVDSVTVQFADPDMPFNFNFAVVFNPAPTTVQDVINRFNAVWAGYGATYASITSSGVGPYILTESTNNLVFKLNGNLAITSDLSGMRYSAEMVAKINADILAAGQAAQGTAVVLGDGFILKSLNTTGPGSTIEILSTSNAHTLQTIGIASGKYTGSYIAKLYGNDEIEFSLPLFGPNSFVNISGTVGVMAKLGLSAGSVTVNASRGEEPYAPTLGSISMRIPEVLEFGDVSTDYDSRTNSFNPPREGVTADPNSNVNNFGISPVLDILGKLPSNTIPRILHFLGLDNLQVGAETLGTGQAWKSPRLSVPIHSPTDPIVLMSESLDTAELYQPVRLYSFNNDTIITRNAKVNASSEWEEDDFGNEAYAVRIKNDGSILLQFKPNTVGSWVDANWNTTIILNSVTNGSPLIEIGADAISTASQLLTTRLKTWGASAGSYHLVWEGAATGSVFKQRIYSSPGLAGGKLAVTNNAKLNTSGQWERDVAGDSSMIEMVDGSVTFYKQLAASASPWVSWDRTTVKADSTGVDVGPTLNLGRSLTAVSTANRETPRIIATHSPSGALSRTMVAKFTQEGVSGNINYYIYRGQGFKTTGEGSYPYPGDVFMISCNAYWNESLSEWNKENAGDNSSLLLLTGSNLGWFYRSGVGLTWPDNSWNLAFQTTKDGIRTPYITDTSNSSAITSLLGTKNGIKAWGSVFISRDGGGVQTIVTGDSWNVSGYSTNAQSFSANLHAPVAWDYPLGQPGFTVITNAVGYLVSPLPTADQCVGVPTSSTQVSFAYYPYNSNVAVNTDNNNTYVGCTFLVLGK